jgi:hypothetical protein
MKAEDLPEKTGGSLFLPGLRGKRTRGVEVASGKVRIDRKVRYLIIRI